MSKAPALVLLFLLSIFLCVEAFAQDIVTIRFSAEATFEKMGALLISGTAEYTFPEQYAAKGVVFLRLPMNALRERNPKVDPVWDFPEYGRRFSPGFTEVERVEVNGRPARWGYESLKNPAISTYSTDRAFLKVEVPEGKSVVVLVRFRTRIPVKKGDDGVWENIAVSRFSWMPLPAFFKDGCWRLSDTLMVHAKFSGSFDPPKGWRCVLGGLGEGETQPSVPLVLFRGLESATVEVGDVRVISYFEPGDDLAGRLLLAYAAEAVKKYRSWMGFFPYRALRIFPVETQGECMAASGVVFISKSFYRTGLGASTVVGDIVGLFTRYFDAILAHEIAHMYFGIGIVPDFDRDNWLSEGFCQYFSVRYFEEKYGEMGTNIFSVGRDVLAFQVEEGFGPFNLCWLTAWPYRDILKTGEDQPILKRFRERKNVDVYSAVIYNKGFMAARALESYLGPEKTMEVLRGFVSRFYGKNKTPEELLQFIKRKTGVDLREYYEKLLCGVGKFDLRIKKVRRLGNKVQVEFEKKGLYDVPVTVRFWYVPEGRKGRKFVDKVVKTSGSLVSVEAELPGEFVEVELDPHWSYPDVNRLNNVYPQRVRFAPFGHPNPPDAVVVEQTPIFEATPWGTAIGLTVSSYYLDDWEMGYTYLSYTDSGIVAHDIWYAVSFGKGFWGVELYAVTPAGMASGEGLVLFRGNQALGIREDIGLTAPYVENVYLSWLVGAYGDFSFEEDKGGVVSPEGYILGLELSKDWGYPLAVAGRASLLWDPTYGEYGANVEISKLMLLGDLPAKAVLRGAGGTCLRSPLRGDILGVSSVQTFGGMSFPVKYGVGFGVSVFFPGSFVKVGGKPLDTFTVGKISGLADTKAPLFVEYVTGMDNEGENLSILGLGAGVGGTFETAGMAITPYYIKFEAFLDLAAGKLIGVGMETSAEIPF